MKKPKKKPTTLALVIVSQEAMVGMLNQYVGNSLAIAQRTAAHAAKIAALNAAFDEDPEIVRLRGEMAVLESSLALYCTNHRGELFPEEKKSREYENATLGFRLDPPSVGKRIADDTFEAIALRLEELDWGGQYVDWKPVLAKEALLRDRAQLSEEQLQTAGIKFEQREKFFIAPKSDAADRMAKPVQEVAA